jgi:hypothetical protein
MTDGTPALYDNRFYPSRNIDPKERVLILLRRIADRGEAPDQAKVVPAQAAPIRLNQPLKGSLKSVPRPDGSEVDGLAVRAASGEEPDRRPHHELWTSALILDGML